MSKSDDIVFTEPVTRPNHENDLLESDSIWLYRDRPVRLYPSAKSDGRDDASQASPRLSKARMTEILEQCQVLVKRIGDELMLRSEEDGFLIVRRIRVGLLVACARPDAGQYKVASELSRFGDSVSGRFASQEQAGELEVKRANEFVTESTSLKNGRVGFDDKLPDDDDLPPVGEESSPEEDVSEPDTSPSTDETTPKEPEQDEPEQDEPEQEGPEQEEPEQEEPEREEADLDEPTEVGRSIKADDVDLDGLTWTDVASDLNEIIEGTSGRFRMFAVKAWRQGSRLVPITFDIVEGFTAEVDAELSADDAREMASVFGNWRSKVETSSGEAPQTFGANPDWYLSVRTTGEQS